ncbi:beta-ketoacyl-[acyl-carrier-protein] synthase family protein (plasmid) [Rhizobium sp. CC1099]|uniref:beta-ketoacyl-[acyl-carrier-protein] synthase family protein n=1 Tax=Rhizobium sp. CC1099 TaxID=3039160 RepID=UPI0024B12C91|nr:beta-ketoacyl-[acyl-carrier-protein] synthase family protein [Rhizobium sp. CC1099]WFU92062.1 beta-ketoacyl-[acyl-carrier-protein] synthase family protein [Rhizobium sp. CC1099]
MARSRIVITGIGGICAMGVGAPSIWEGMRAGRSAIGEIAVAPVNDLKIRIGAEVKQLPGVEFDRKRLVTMDRYSLLAVLAAGEALRQSGLVVDEANTSRIGAVVGTAIFGAETLEDNYRGLFIDRKPRTNVFAVPRAMPGAPAGQVSIVYGLRGPVFGVSSACSSSNHAFISACDQLRLGRADVMLAGGTDAPLTFGILKAWEALRAVARETCRPFSADRDGLVLGEGAGIAVLETYEHAAARGAPILAELAGTGMSGDASDIVAPTIEGPVAAINACLADAGLLPEDIDYVNAHGTGTKFNDHFETQAIRRVFGKHADALSVSSTKSMHAHCLGASGAIELIACVMAIREGTIPPTANYREKDPDCDLDVTPNVARERKVRAAINNSFAFGGTNAVVAIKEA